MDFLSQLSLRNPWWLLLALQPLVFWVFAVMRQRRQQDDFADTKLLPWVLSPRGVRGARRWLRQLAWLLAWCAFAIAMAGPRSLQRIIDRDESHYLVLQVVVDVSYSMSARDVIPTRLQRVRLELHDLIERLQQVRMGLIVYAARAHVMIPPTSDKSVIRHAVDLIHVRELPTEGSDMFNALAMARQQLAGQPDQPRAILLISDGEVNENTAQAQQQLTQLVTSLRQENIHLYSLGVGTAQGAALLNDQNGWLQQDGRTVVTRLQADRLRKLAQAGNGAYAGVADNDSEWRSLYDNGIARLATTAADAETGQTLIWRDLSPWFVLPGILLLLLATLQLPGRYRDSAAVGLLAVVLAAVLHAPSTHAAEEAYPAAYALYQAGKYQEAMHDFSRLPGYAARMGEAASLYQLQQYAQAATVYIQAVLDADNDRQRAVALFNLGNSYFKQAAYARAANTYRDVLRYQPQMHAAKINLDYAQALLDKSSQNPAAVVNRAGTGVRMAPAIPGTDVGKGRVSIDESESQTPEQRAQQIDTSPQQAANDTILQQARPAAEQIELNKDTQWTYDIRHAQDISARDTHFRVDESQFWQRLYETEEDYPAPRERPEVLPGVAPW